MHKSARFTIGATLIATAVCLNVSVEARELIQNKGSDTLVNVAQAWAEAYRRKFPRNAEASSFFTTAAGPATFRVD